MEPALGSPSTFISQLKQVWFVRALMECAASYQLRGSEYYLLGAVATDTKESAHP
jgi:hypothetical protein